MKNLTVKFSPTSKEVEKVEATGQRNRSLKKRIDEEGLFGLFTADIIKQKKKFTR